MRILMIDDDQEFCTLLQAALKKERHTVDCCHTGDDGLYFMRERVHDLVLLDRMLPCIDGLSIIQITRKEGIQTPVIMITALGGIDDKVDGLDFGADDYLVKPFSTKELLSRIRAVGRRPQAWTGGAEVTLGDLQFKVGEHLLYKGDRCITLTKKESDLFHFLLKNQDQTVPRAMLLSYVWGMDTDVEDGNLDTYIHFLRKHLKELASQCRIETVRNVGYKMTAGAGHVS